MKKNAFWLTGFCTVLLLTGLCLTGCGLNEAQEAGDAPEPADPRESALAERERSLAEREGALADLESQLTARMRQIETRVEEMEGREARLAEREAALEAESIPEPVAPEPEPAARTVFLTLPRETPIEVAFEDSLSSETSLIGDVFRASVSRDVFSDGLLAIPAGTEVRGTVTSVTSQKRIGGQARLSLSFDQLDLPSGESIAISAYTEAAGRPQKKKDAATIGGSAAGGAILGRVLSNKKSKGTAIGAIVGAAVGAAVASENAGDPVVIEPGMVGELFLESPIEVS
jgi:hypothetical protein